jgi:hypothetical protein
MEQKINQQIKKLKNLDIERKGWLMVSGFIIISILGIIFDWNTVMVFKLQYALVGAGLIISVVWWFWTMRIIRLLINHRIVETETLKEILIDIKSIRREINTEEP